jgi:acyl-CoA reductase-like NAD-dependent aldehyde dehydrogenase
MSRLDRDYRLLIGGELRGATNGDTFDVTSPATNEVITRAPAGSLADVNQAVSAARAAFDSGPWRDLEIKVRVEMLRRLGQLILDAKDELAEIEARDTGNPIRFTRDFYIPGAAGCLQFYPPLAYHLSGQHIPVSQNYLDYTLYEPLGVVAVIVPWNDPLEIACGRLGSALGAGNTCILKPSPLAPLTCLLLGELAIEAGLPTGVLNVLSGADAEVGTPLIHHAGVDMISFTGSIRTGELIQQAAATSTKRVCLEMGGKSPNIVFPDADLDKAVPGSAEAVLLMTGQNCVAGTRLLLHEKIHDEFVERLVRQFGQYAVGDPLDPATFLGPIISKAQLQKVKQYVQSGIEEGAALVTGGDAPEGPSFAKGNYFAPTLFTDVKPSMRIAREEIFGPVLSVFRFSSTEEAVALANDTEYGLGAGLWTRDLKLAHRVAARLRAGTVYVNTYNEFFLHVPFAGHRRSGLGSEYGLDALQQDSQRKNVMVRLD